MDLLCAALAVLAITAALMIFMALYAVRCRTQLQERICHILGASGIFFACILGVFALFQGSWDTIIHTTLPWGLPLGHGSLGLDALSRIFLLPVFIVGALCALSGALTMLHHPTSQHNTGAHWAFFTVLLLALVLVCTARDAIFFLVAWELMSLAPFFLIEFNDHIHDVRDAAWVYLVAAHVGALFLLVCFGLLWSTTGSTDFAAFTLFPTTAVASAIFCCGLVGFGAKAGLAPLHIWLPEAHPVAPSHVSAVLSGVMINAGLYGFMRLLHFFPMLHEAPAWWGWGALMIGVCTGFIGIFKAMAQSHLKRALAYSSVENMGIMFMGVGVGLIGVHTYTPWIACLGFTGALMHMLNHAAFKSLLFLCAGGVLHAARSLHMEHLGGLQKHAPFMGIAFAIGAASIACLPPFSGFFGEFLLVLGMAHSIHLPSIETPVGLLFALVCLALISGFAAATFVKLYGIVFLGEARSTAAAQAQAPPWSEYIPLMPLLIACVGLGLGAGWIFPHIIKALPVPVIPAHITHIVDILHNIAFICLGGIGVALGIYALRCVLLRGIKTPTHFPTWGCGFQTGTAGTEAIGRIQYTAASFSEPITHFFAGSMGVKIQHGMDKGYFPAHAFLKVTLSDRVRSLILNPLFEGIVRLCDAAKIIQHGRIHLYILYMLATVVALLIWALHTGGQA